MGKIGGMLMAAFGAPWGDLDKTKREHIYVPDSEGWGWMALFLIVAVPFLMLGQAVSRVSLWICAHPLLTAGLYLVGSLVFGIIFYSRSGMRHRGAGILASVVTMLPLGGVEACYAIPYLVLKSGFSGVSDWIFVGAILFGLTFFLFSICNLLQNGWIHLILAAIFMGIGVVFIQGLRGMEPELLRWSEVARIYGFQ